MAKARHVPERRCVACGQRAPKRHLTRIVRTPKGTVSPDDSGKSSGRGAYLCNNTQCWENGIRKGSLERSLQVGIDQQDREVLLHYFQERVDKATSVEG